METMASSLLRAARKASAASRAAAATASRVSAMASRSASARAAGVAAAVARAARLGSGLTCPLKSCPNRGDASTKPRDDAPRHSFTIVDRKQVPDDAKTPTDKDLESDEAVWALYERWCRAFNKKRDHTQMVCRFKIFRHTAERVHRCNTYVPDDPEEAAIHLQKRREAELLLSKDQDVSCFEDWHLPKQLGPLSDGGDPCLRERDYDLYKVIEETQAHRAVKDVAVE